MKKLISILLLVLLLAGCKLGQGSVRLKWNEYPNTFQYLITEIKNNSVVQETINGNQTSAELGYLEEGKYFFEVCARNSSYQPIALGTMGPVMVYEYRDYTFIIDVK